MNVIDLIKNEDYYVKINRDFKRVLYEKYKITKRNIKINASYQTMMRIFNEDNYYTHLKTYYSLCKELKIPSKKVIASITSIKTKMSKPTKIKKLEVNAPFVRIIGHILGDGGIHVIKAEKKFRAFYVNNEKILLNSFIQDVRDVFGGIEIYYRYRKEHGNEVWVPTSVGFLLYKLLNYERNKNNKRIPSFIFQIKNKKVLGAFLQALYDDEGYLYPQKHMIVISQKSKKLINDIRKIVIKVGIRPNKILIHKPKNRTKMHYFSITHKNNILKFYKLIGFKHRIKMKKLNILVNKYRL